MNSSNSKLVSNSKNSNKINNNIINKLNIANTLNTQINQYNQNTDNINVPNTTRNSNTNNINDNLNKNYIEYDEKCILNRRDNGSIDSTDEKNFTFRNEIFPNEILNTKLIVR